MNVNDIKRNSYDLSNWVMSCGAIGSLQTLLSLPIVAGDTIDLDFNGVFRLSPQRRNLYLDAKVSLFILFVPHRHIYSNWVDFIKEGYDEAQALGVDAITDYLACLGSKVDHNEDAPRWLTRGYMKIWNRYFKNPDDSDSAEDLMITLTGDDRQDYGMECCHLKNMWNTGRTSNLTTADYQLATGGTHIDLMEFAQLQSRLKTEQDRDWFGIRYNDLLKKVWDSNVNTDADERPELIMRNDEWLSGTDVNGTDDATLGNFISKSVSVCGINMPPKFFSEHGTLWVMCLVRFPPVHNREVHFLTHKANPTYKEIAGDPEVIKNEPPYDLNADEIFFTGAANSLGLIPYAQWYRYQPSIAHRKYDIIEGHPFIETVPTSIATATYIDNATYDAVFASTQLKHWQVQGHFEINALRCIPEVHESIYAGTRK